MRKIFIVGNTLGGSSEYINWINDSVEVKDMNEADLVMFTGGEDVTPSFYNEYAHPQTQSNARRDIHEEYEFKRAQRLGKKMIGICRGSQFLCVMAGGKLIQHQSYQPYLHTMRVLDKKDKILISSTHHQAQFPFNLDRKEYKIIGWTEGLSQIHQGADHVEMFPDVECEIVYYPEICALGIQGHPEKLKDDRDIWSRKFEKEEALSNEIKETLDYCNELVNKLLDNKF